MIASLIPAAISLGTSIYQGIQANKLGKTQDPTFKIPKEAEQSLQNAAMLAQNKEMAGQTLIENKLAGSTAAGANQIKQMGGGAAGMGAIVDLFANQQGQLGDIAIQAEKEWLNKNINYQGALNGMASWKNLQNQWERDKYTSAMQQSSDLKGAAMQNLYNAGKGAANGIINNKVMGMQEDYISRLNKETGNILGGGVGTENGSKQVNNGTPYPFMVGGGSQRGGMVGAPNYGFPTGSMLYEGVSDVNPNMPQGNGSLDFLWNMMKTINN